jgi:3-methyladenine DNA glycosylase AlkD
MTAQDIEIRLQALGNPLTAQVLHRFFKTGPGQYGKGDVFLGLKVPQLRRLARDYQGLPHAESEVLLASPFHECRLLSLLLLVRAFVQGEAATQKAVYDLYLRNTARINNWDLVDASAEHIVGGYLRDCSRKPLYRLAGSQSLWERRISILATFHFLKFGDFAETLGIAEKLLADPHDLIHKAVGWMLREIGKRNPVVEERFLTEHYQRMPRTMLRYAIERFPEGRRRQYLKGSVDVKTTAVRVGRNK